MWFMEVIQKQWVSGAAEKKGDYIKRRAKEFINIQEIQSVKSQDIKIWPA